jgi:leucyl-tRNA synthetase
MGRFIERIERAIESGIEEISKECNNRTSLDKADKELNYWRYFAIKGVSEDAEKLQFNTAIARLMELTNALSKYVTEENINKRFLKEVLVDYLKLIAPFAPHFAEENWETLGMGYSIFNQSWPEFDASALIKDEIEIALQVNGKIKSKINVSSDLDEEGIKEVSLKDETVIAALEGKTVRKVIVIKGRLVNIVV